VRVVTVVILTRWNQVRDAFRTKELRQAGYTAGAVVTADTLLDLHGNDHRERRRVENRLFRREIFSYWEHEVLGHTVAATLGPFVQAGRGDLAQIGYRSAISLTATIAGVDHDPADGEATELLYGLVKKFGEGATLMHSTRDRDEVRAEVRAAIETFGAGTYRSSLASRQALVDRFESGDLAEDDLPKDVLTTLLRSRDRLELTDEVLLREICLYLQAGAHSTSNAFTHTVDDLLQWGLANPDELEAARGDLAFVQRCMHESLRLNPSSPIAYRRPLSAVELSDGTHLPEGCTVELDMVAANRDPAIFGDDADDYDPNRTMPDGIQRWGLSFGAGTHACIGAELDGGLEVEANRESDDQLYGTVAVMAHAFLEAGGRQDPNDPPQLDPASIRKHYGSYPVLFG
jgi:cytochrome P450